MTEKFVKITVTFEKRPDGGLRAWCPEVPGMVLSSTDIEGVLEDVKTALSTILSMRYNEDITVSPLGNVREDLEHNGIVAAPRYPVPGEKEYVAYKH